MLETSTTRVDCGEELDKLNAETAASAPGRTKGVRSSSYSMVNSYNLNAKTFLPVSTEGQGESVLSFP